MSVEERLCFLIIAAVGFPHGNFLRYNEHREQVKVPPIYVDKRFFFNSRSHSKAFLF